MTKKIRKYAGGISKSMHRYQCCQISRKWDIDKRNGVSVQVSLGEKKLGAHWSKVFQIQ